MNVFIYRCLWLLHVVQVWLTKHLTPVGRGVLLIWVVSAFIGLGSAQSLCHVIFFLASALLLIAIIGSRWIHYQVRVTRQLPRFGVVGDSLKYRVTLHNVTPQVQKGLKLMENPVQDFPSLRTFRRWKGRHGLGWLWRWHRYLLKQRRAIASPQDLPALAAKTKTTVTVEMTPLRRGHLSLETLTIACPDPLGLVYRRQTHYLPQSLYILPPHYQLPPPDLSSSRKHPAGEVALAASIGEDLEFRALRDYRPGDPTNKIHWKSWAKIGRPIVKEHQDEAVAHYGLILDTFSEEADDVFEAAVAVATSVVRQSQTTLDLIFTAEEPCCLTVGQRAGQTEQALEMLAMVQPCATHSVESLTPLIHRRFPDLSGCICILTEIDEARRPLLELLVQYDLPIKVIHLMGGVIAPDEQPVYALSANCTVHFASLRQLQQDLLRI